jgi:phage repressor protein C with HTH and peptisase S24 domain
MTTAITKIMKEKGISQAELAKALGVARQTVGVWQKTGRMSSSVLPRVAAALQVSAGALVGEETTEQGQTVVRVVSDIPIPEGFIRIPVLDVYGSCGNSTQENSFELVTGAVDMAAWFARSLPGVTSINRLQIVSSSGDSMAPTIGSRSMVIVDRNQSALRGDGVFCFRVGSDLYIKRIQRNLDGTLTLLSDNPQYQPRTIDRADLPQSAVIGRVVYVFNGNSI